MGLSLAVVGTSVPKLEGPDCDPCSSGPGALAAANYAPDETGSWGLQELCGPVKNPKDPTAAVGTWEGTPGVRGNSRAALLRPALCRTALVLAAIRLELAATGQSDLVLAGLLAGGDGGDGGLAGFAGTLAGVAGGLAGFAAGASASAAVALGGFSSGAVDPVSGFSFWCALETCLVVVIGWQGGFRLALGGVSSWSAPLTSPVPCAADGLPGSDHRGFPEFILCCCRKKIDTQKVCLCFLWLGIAAVLLIAFRAGSWRIPKPYNAEKSTHKLQNTMQVETSLITSLTQGYGPEFDRAWAEFIFDIEKLAMLRGAGRDSLTAIVNCGLRYSGARW